MQIKKEFQAGGTLAMNAFYVERKADGNLRSRLKAGKFCGILGPRQIGKSSLYARTIRAIGEAATDQSSQIRFGYIDLLNIGASGVTPEQFYFGLVELASQSLNLKFNYRSFWKSPGSLSVIERWEQFLEVEIPAHTDERLVLALDEIDCITQLRTPGGSDSTGDPFFRQEFFDIIRRLSAPYGAHHAKGDLSFCLIGGLPPHDILSEPNDVLFQGENWMHLHDLEQEPARFELSPGLAQYSDRPEKLFDSIFTWTRGHPFFTQLICCDIINKGFVPAGTEDDTIHSIVKTRFLQRGRWADPNLGYTLGFLNEHAASWPKLRSVYEKLLSGKLVPMEWQNTTHVDLWFSGLAGLENENLQIRNRIYEQVFDSAWCGDYAPSVVRGK